MGLFRRKTADSRRPTSGSPVGAVSVRRSRESVTATAPAPPAPVKKVGPEMYTGTVTEFEATAAQRINSAEDVDPNVKRYGVDGVFKGGGGGFGGAGTK
ncbi:MAG TPA: hypothetical protein VEZ46_11220 [Mycobacteriales bacterium]|jgi:hypothetical protein|nr:hypothetical protein [Mycobacteriales bacterium]